ncbi:GntR family transcriptional regulator [Clostridium amazonitimonense]|uniref:GntR family transcriptional regulator n=1 Tax=Clostridium amazonitimonense TaxID=1499689 RepID=UPI000509E42F|nr:GntR family transcriptional regulator [Clostridium amazonitimonense]
MIAINIIVAKKSGIPLYLQVKKQIMDHIRNGSLKVGTKMPTERELAETLKVSRNTVSSAYKELEKEGVLKSYQGRGTFVAEEDKPWKEKNVKDKIIRFVDIGIEEALESGMDIEEFLDIVTTRVKEKSDFMRKLTAVYVECNIEQSRMFSRELSSAMNMNVVPLTIGDLKEMKEETVDILEKSQVVIATFNHVNEVSKLIERFNKEIFGVAINADLETIVKIARYPNETKFGFLCISEEFMFKIQRALESAGLGGIDIRFTNAQNESQVKELIEASDVIIVSPGRYKETEKFNRDKKDVIKFIYSLDDGSVKALRSKILEINHKN